MSRQPTRCVACGTALPVVPAVAPGGGRAPVGRPRRYCSQRCRQRAYRDRTDEAVPAAPPVAADQVTVRRAWLSDVADRIYQLDCAVQDVRTALSENATRAELAAVCQNLLDSSTSLRPTLRRISSL